jgi:hypothetical protein
MSRETEEKEITLRDINTNLSKVTLFLVFHMAQQIEAMMTIWNFSRLDMKTWNHVSFPK